MRDHEGKIAFGVDLYVRDDEFAFLVEVSTIDVVAIAAMIFDVHKYLPYGR